MADEDLGKLMTPEQAWTALDIGKSQYYVHAKAIQVTVIRENGNGKAYLAEGEFERLQQYLARQNGAITTVNDDAIEKAEIVDGDYSDPDDEQLEQLVREAAELKTEQILLPDLLRLEMAAQMTEDDLPEDLKEKVRSIRSAAAKKPNPAAIASQLLARHRQKK